MGEIQVYCAVSLDGFIAGPDDDLSWLGEPEQDQAGESDTVSFSDFMQQTGAMLMGRRTFDVVMAFGGSWPYGSTPVLVATSRAMPQAPASVSSQSGDIRELCQRAKRSAGTGNVYVDGGGLISQALDADCIDEIILTVAPVLLGRGVPIYRGEQLHRFESQYLGKLGEMMQVRLTRAT